MSRQTEKIKVRGQKSEKRHSDIVNCQSDYILSKRKRQNAKPVISVLPPDNDLSKKKLLHKMSLHIIETRKNNHNFISDIVQNFFKK